MYRTTFALLLAFMLPSPLFAQPANPYDGKWKLTFDGPRTTGLEGTVVVKGDSGTWNLDLTGQSRNACFKHEAPIAVESATADELIFKLNRSKVLAGCEDTTMRFKKINDKTLKLDARDGRIFTLTRQ